MFFQEFYQCLIFVFDNLIAPEAHTNMLHMEQVLSITFILIINSFCTIWKLLLEE